MKFLVVLPLLAAAVLGAPAPQFFAAQPAGLALAAPAPLTLAAAPAVVHTAPAVVRASPVVHAAPVVHHVQVPVTKTVHFGVQDVVTGFSTSIINPSINSLPTPEQHVTQEKVLAPVRTHTQITPQVTHVVPEVTVREVVHDVPVATPVVAEPIVHHQFAEPIVHHQIAAPVVQPQVLSAGNLCQGLQGVQLF